MVGNTVKFIGSHATIAFLKKNDCSPLKIYPPPPDFPRHFLQPWRDAYWESEHWGTDDRDINEYYIVKEWKNALVVYFRTDRPPYLFYEYLAKKFDDLYIKAGAGYITQISELCSLFIADHDDDGKRRCRFMEWEEYMELEGLDDDDFDINEELLQSESYYEDRKEAQRFGTNPNYYSGWLDILQTHDVWKDVEQDEQYDLLYEDDDELYHPCTHGYDLDHKYDWVSYDAWVCGYLEYMEELEIYDLEQDHQDAIAWLEYENFFAEEESWQHEILYDLRGEKNILYWYVDEPDNPCWWKQEFEVISLDVELHDVWKDVEQEEQEEIDQLLPYELCCGCECVRSFYYGQYHQDYDNDWTTWDNWMDCWRKEQEEIEDWKLMNDIPTEEELYFDELRRDRPAIFKQAEKEGCKIKNPDDFERLENEMIDYLTQEAIGEAYREEQELLEEIPTEDELEFDQCRTDHQGIFAIANEKGMKPKITNVEEYERNERDLNDWLIQEQLYQVFLEEQEVFGEIPTEDEIFYSQIEIDEAANTCLITGDEIGSTFQDRTFDWLWDRYNFQSIGWVPETNLPGYGIPAFSGIGYILMFNKHGEIFYEDEWIHTDFFRMLYEHDIYKQMEEEDEFELLYQGEEGWYEPCALFKSCPKTNWHILEKIKHGWYGWHGEKSKLVFPENGGFELYGFHGGLIMTDTLSYDDLNYEFSLHRDSE
jgi:hypothetical protein